MDGYAPAGAVVSTITDMSRLAVSLLDGSAPGRDALVAFEGIDTEVPNRSSGMFWIVDSIPGTDRTFVWHNGQTGGYSAFFALFPQAGRAVVVLANVARAAEQQRIALALARSKRR
jgi:CubicO group peptidase (beta-lactamase class C family)